VAARLNRQQLIVIGLLRSVSVAKPPNFRMEFKTGIQASLIGTRLVECGQSAKRDGVGGQILYLPRE
jgi:hypothetical protein